MIKLRTSRFFFERAHGNHEGLQKWRWEEGRSVRGSGGYGRKVQKDAVLLTLMMKDEGRKPKNVGRLQKPGWVRKHILP